MHGYRPNSYGDAFADIYDDWYPHVPDVDRAVARLQKLAEGGAVLELGCGTGRLCLPLAQCGLEVHGIDASEAMLARLQAKGNAVSVQCHHADMAAFELVNAPRFSLAFCAFNTYFNLASADAQSGCLASVAHHLAPAGRLVLECYVPGDAPQDPVDNVEVRDLTTDRVVLRISRQDPLAQTVSGQHVELTNGGVRLRPWHLRYASPEEIDATAATHGFTLEQRWADWAGLAFGVEATNHVSVYRLGGPRG